MEIELKYLVQDQETVERIFSDEFVTSLIDTNSKKVIPMEAIYYDTEDGSLHRAKAAFRIRKEGESHIATAKWGGGASGGMHTREEVNVMVDQENLDNPSIQCLKETQAFEHYQQLVGNKDLIPVVKMNFNRTEYHMNIGDTSCILSADFGAIEGICKNESINEIEIELYSGKEEDMLIVGEYLHSKFHISPCNISKLSRGLRLNGIK